MRIPISQYFILLLFFSLIITSCAKDPQVIIDPEEGSFSFITDNGYSYTDESAKITINPWTLKITSTEESGSEILSRLYFKRTPSAPLSSKYTDNQNDYVSFIYYDDFYGEKNGLSSVDFRITEYDSIKHQISGTFKLTLVNSKDKIIKITGKFNKVKYSPTNYLTYNNVTIPSFYENEFNSVMTYKNECVVMGDTMMLASIKGMYRFGVQFKIPANISLGKYPISNNGAYKAATVHDSQFGYLVENATSGTITIVQHDVNAKVISGNYDYYAPFNKIDSTNYKGEFFYRY